jgi:ATP-dependent phosphoenolpyruvate carboxykinase
MASKIWRLGRSPKDKRIVDEASSTNDVWWGPVNIKMDDNSFLINRERAVVCETFPQLPKLDKL